MGTPTHVRNFVAEAAISKYRIVKHGTADGQVVQAAAVGDAMFGVAAEIDAAISQRVDVIVAGVADVEAGGAITRGDPITSDANGKALASAPAAGVNNRVIGFALVSAVSGDILPVQLSPGRIQG